MYKLISIFIKGCSEDVTLLALPHIFVNFFELLKGLELFDLHSILRCDFVDEFRLVFIALLHHCKSKAVSSETTSAANLVKEVCVVRLSLPTDLYDRHVEVDDHIH